MTLEQTLETVAKIQKAWDALALSISDAAEAFAKMWEEVFSIAPRNRPYQRRSY